jgi:hypothetical protein
MNKMQGTNINHNQSVKEEFSDNGIRFNNSRIILIVLLILLAGILLFSR